MPAADILLTALKGMGATMVNDQNDCAALRRLGATLVLSLAAGSMAAADEPPEHFADLALEDLLRINVTSVSGVETALADTPAAIFVITNEDIRRGGHHTIADALRMVPGLHVANIYANTWAVGARGFNSRFAGELLVLVDGRAVYNDIFSGTFWDEVDLLLEDIDRIEVIRGPGATIWGANAVNGVINIVSRSAADTHGLYLTAGGGTEAHGFGGFRYGFSQEENLHLRFWAKYANRDQSPSVAGGDAPDDWRQFRTGFRLDLGEPDAAQFTIDAGAYAGMSGAHVETHRLTSPFTIHTREDEDLSGGHFRLRLADESSRETGWSVQAYFDQAQRLAPSFSGRRETVDVEWRQYFRLGESHHILWGAGYRHRRDRTDGNSTFFFDPAGRSTDKFSFFVQDTITIIEDRLTMLTGSKFEHNSYSGFEVQPTARLTWTPDEQHTIWGAVSRAVRTPSRIESDLRLVADIAMPPLVPFPMPIAASGDDDVKATELIAYELGYRAQLAQRLTFDIAGFYHDYNDVMCLHPVGGNPLVNRFGNKGTSESYGVELATTWQVADNWQLAGAYTFTRAQTHGHAEEEDTFPQQSANLRSHLNLTDDLEFNAAVYFVDEIPYYDIPAYVRLDLGLTWRPRPNVEIAIWAQNLLDDAHPEFADPFVAGPSGESERAIYGQVSIQF